MDVSSMKKLGFLQFYCTSTAEIVIPQMYGVEPELKQNCKRSLTNKIKKYYSIVL